MELLPRELLGGLPVLGLEAGIGACADEGLDAVDVPAPRGPVERGLVVGVEGVDVGTTLDEEEYHVEVPAVGGPVKCSVPVLI